MSAGGRLHTVARQLQAAPARAVTDAAQVVADAAAATGARAAPRGVAGRRLGATVTVRASASTATARVQATPVGPWVLLDSGARPHAEGTRSDYLHGRGYPHPVRGPVRHPGARGRHVWDAAVARAAGPALVAAATDAVHEAAGRG